MGGSIELESRSGAGSTFRVTAPLLPVSLDRLRSTSSEPLDQANLRADLNVMLVEDDMVNQVVMEAVLRDLGVQVLTADSGERALDLWSRKPSTWCSWIAIARAWTASRPRAMARQGSLTATHAACR
jgi:hypothetical protein